MSGILTILLALNNELTTMEMFQKKLNSNAKKYNKKKEKSRSLSFHKKLKTVLTKHSKRGEYKWSYSFGLRNRDGNSTLLVFRFMRIKHKNLSITIKGENESYYEFGSKESDSIYNSDKVRVDIKW